MILRNILITVLYCACFSFVSRAQQVIDAPFGKGIINVIAKDSSWSMKFATRIQLLSTSTIEVNETVPPTVDQNFLVRRARLKFNGFAFSPTLSYKIELGLSNNDIAGGSLFTGNTPRYIFDAVVMWNFSSTWELWLGQAKLPGNIERVVSSGNLQFVDRSILNARFNIDRDLGLQLRHQDLIGKHIIVREKIALSQGEGRNVTAGNKGGLQYTGRLEILPFGTFMNNGDYSSSDLNREPNPKLMVAATYDHNNNAVRDRSNLGNPLLLLDGSLFETNINTFFADVIFKYQGFSLQGEFARRDATSAIAIEEDATPTGDIVNVGNSLNVQAGYLLDSNWEFSGRYTTVNLDAIAGGTRTNQYTTGVSKYLSGHKFKVQSDLSYTIVNNQEDNWMLRLQMDVHF